jgi:hypothetical protein
VSAANCHGFRKTTLGHVAKHFTACTSNHPSKWCSICKTNSWHKACASCWKSARLKIAQISWHWSVYHQFSVSFHVDESVVGGRYTCFTPGQNCSWIPLLTHFKRPNLGRSTFWAASYILIFTIFSSIFFHNSQKS